MLPSVKAYVLPYSERVIFMHNRCSIHTARTVTRWLNDQRNLEILDWPSKACDMNPIENVWASMVNVWEPAEERTGRLLQEHTFREWEVLSRNPQLIYDLSASIPWRLRQVVEHNGGWIKY